MRRPISSKYYHHFLIWLSLLFLGLFHSCEETDSTLAPYSGQRLMSNITIEEGSFIPQLTWIGGYSSVVAVNRGPYAALDSTLIWLIYAPNNNLHYPVKFGETPSGAVNLTAEYGGHQATELVEDSSYTFWIMKDEAWLNISDFKEKKIFTDTSSTSSSVRINGDSILVGQNAYAQKFANLDVYINIENIKSVGKLANIIVKQPFTDNNPWVTWEIKQNDVTDSLISALGIVEGQSYNPQKIVWEVYSVDSTSGTPVYGKNNIIERPIQTGQVFGGTQVFVSYPDNGLERDKDYYLWIANKEWDGEGRLRVTNYYAYVTFHTW